MKLKETNMFYMALFILISHIRSERYCGYKGDLSKRIESNLDDCYTQNVIESRVRMAVGFEHCFGYNYEKLNSTVEAPFEKRLNDTNRHIVHLAFKICSDEENGIDDDFYVIDSQGTSLSDLTGTQDNRAPEDVRGCKTFFQKLLDALTVQNFEVDDIISSNEKSIIGLVKNSDSRDKLFTIVREIIRPLNECRTPMIELRTTLIKKYLKQFLIAQINPPMPSFTPQSYQVLLHPEMFMLSQDTNLITDFNDENDPSLKATRFAANLIGNKRIVVLHKRTDTEKLSKSQKETVIDWDKDNKDKSPQEIEAMLNEDIADGKVSKDTKLVLTPAQKLKAGLMNEADYQKLIALPENHIHGSDPVEIEKFWDDNLIIKKKRFHNEDFDRYKIKGFDIDQKIKQLFKTI